RVRALAVRGEDGPGEEMLIKLFDSTDPFLRQAAIHEFGRWGLFLRKLENRPLDATQRVGYLLAWRSATGTWREFTKLNPTAKVMRGFLNDPDESVRFLAVKWVADEKLADYRKDVENLVADPNVSVRMYMACATALARIDGKEVTEKSLTDY